MSTGQVTDEQLGRRALAGDRDAFTELFARHESGLFNVSYRLTGNREDAADITQEAFLRVFARLDDLAGREVNLAAYLHRTARNLVYDRSAERARETPTDQVEHAAGADPSLEADPQLSALIADQGSDVRSANARLPERHRLALALRELEGMGYEDIGRVLDITPSAVAQLLVRARTALRRELRLGQVDAEAMDPGCRARLGEIGALIDGELDADRTHVLTQHLALCPACREARAGFEQARVGYRAWLPLPILGLGTSVARAAVGRGLVRFAGTGRRARFLRGGSAAGGGAGGFLASKRRAGAVVGSSILGALLLFGAPTLVAVRSGSSPPPPPAPVEQAVVTTPTTAAPRATTAAPPATTTSAATPGAPAVAPAAPAAARAPAAIPDPTSSPAPPPVIVIRPRTTRTVPPPAAPPVVTDAGTPAAPDPPAPGTTTSAPPVDPPPSRDDPGTTTTRDPVTPPRDPGTTTTRDPVTPPRDPGTTTTRDPVTPPREIPPGTF